MNPNLLGLDATQLAGFFAQAGEKPLRANQLLRWMHQFGEADFSNMSNLAKPLRQRLALSAVIEAPRVVSDTTAADGTRKWLVDVGRGNAVETVFIPEANRGTLCVSSQAGCALDCKFCSTGKQGFNRNLTAAEIIGQLWIASRALARDAESAPQPGAGKAALAASKSERMVSNVVMMGMGEPLANFDNVVTAMRVMLDDNAYGLSRRRVTLSTAGIVPAIDRLREACPVALAVSLHAPDDALRDVLVPINRKYPLAQLLAACRRYLDQAPRDFITFEYVMLDGVNDSAGHARQLVQLVREVPCKFNLIPFNPFPNSGFRRSPRDAIRRFAETLIAAGLVVTTRKTRGDDIDAACGQLAGKVEDKTRRRRQAPEMQPC